MRVALYLRVSKDEQTVENQRQALQKAASGRGWQIVAEYADDGISGAKGRSERPALDRMLKDAVKGQFDVVAAWSVDRVGRNLRHLVETLGELQAAGVQLLFLQQALDTTTPSGKALFGMLGVFAEFEHAMIKDRIRAGIARARAEGRTIGQPAIPDVMVRRVQAALAFGKSTRAAAEEVGVSASTAARIARRMKAASAGELTCRS